MKFITAIGSWLTLKWNLLERLEPLHKKIKLAEFISKERSTMTTTYDLILLNLREDLNRLTNYMYRHLPFKATQGIQIVLKALEKCTTPIVSIKSLSEEVSNMKKAEVILILRQLNTTGRIILFPVVGVVVTNVSWFVQVINLILTKWTGPLNGNRVWCISSKAVISSESELKSLLSSVCNEETFPRIMSILHQWGLVFRVDRSWTEEARHWDPPIWNLKDENILFVSWHQLAEADSNRNLVENKAENSQESKVKVNIVKRLFPTYNSLQFNKDDVAFKFSFKFRIGIPCNLFGQVVGRILLTCRTLLVWNQGILIREGAVDILILHNIHASRGSSSFDIESRIRGPVNGRRPVAVREHMWCVLSDILTIVESSILEYPHLHHKLRHYCRGQCFIDLGQENTFSQPQISRSYKCSYVCNKCEDYQMSQTNWQYILGRQLILPNHEIDKYKKQSCQYCWKRSVITEMIWKMQRTIYPVYSSLVFSSASLVNLRGNLIYSSSSESKIYSRTKCSQYHLRSTDFLVVDPTFCSIHFIHRHLNDTEKKLLSWNLESGEVESQLEKVDRDDVKWPDNNLFIIKPGDTITMNFTNDNASGDKNIIFIINNVVVSILRSLDSNHITMCVKVAPESDGVEKLKIILSNTDAGIVHALHFRPGMVLLLKGETKWEPAVVIDIQSGKLNCLPLRNLTDTSDCYKLADNRIVSPLSRDILPPGFYPSEINCTLDSKNQKSLADSWYKIFSQYPEFSPAPFGLFPKIKEKNISGSTIKHAYEPLPVFGLQSKECITSIYAPSRLLRIALLEKSANSRIVSSYLPLPQPFTPEQFLMPQRQTINAYSNHSLHRLCPGTLWRGYLRDYHPMNEPSYEMSEGESTYFFTGDVAVDIFLLIKNFSNSLSAEYQSINHCFPLIDPNINKNMLRDGIISISKVYRDIILFDIVSRIGSYDQAILQVDKNVIQYKKTKKNPRKIARVKAKSRPQIDRSSSRMTTWTDEEKGNILNMIFASEEVCESHSAATKAMHIPDLGGYTQCVGNIILQKEEMKNVSETALVKCTGLKRFELDFGILDDITWIQYLPKLTSLTLSNCGLKKIGSEIENLKVSLRQLSLISNPIKEIPDFLCQFVLLDNLSLDNTLISNLPKDFGSLKLLRYLSIEHTKLSSLPSSFSHLKNLVTLKLSGVAPPNIFGKSSNMSFKKTNWIAFCKKTQINGWAFNEDEAIDSFDKFVNPDGTLTVNQFDDFNDYLFDFFPRFKEFPVEICGCISLQSLIMGHQAFPNVPEDIKHLVDLRRVVFDGCRYLQNLDGHLGSLPLEVLSSQNCDNLKTPPIEIRRQGMRNTIAYLLRLVSGSEACYRTKLMLVGLGGAGKTSLMRALMSSDFIAPHLAEEAITDGIEINTWSTKQSGDVTLQFSVWDFAGQTLYYNTHQFFLTGRSIYLLLWNVRQGFEHAGLDFWLNSITCHAPNAPIFIVGTHSDKVDKSEIPVALFQSRYQSIVGFHTVSSLTGKGIKQLHDEIIQITLQQPYIGEIVPNAWLRLEKDLISQRSSADYLKWESVKTLATNNAIYEAEVHQAIRFLHDLGSVQYFELPLLKDFVIINSQWLVDVMACVVSVKHDVIENGKLLLSKIGQVWPDYPPTIHKWLLRLTEIFDLTFSVPGAEYNYVPCLLPVEQPDFDWPMYVDASEVKESNMIYQFEYLPPGLFNRAQVRLSQYSDSFVIWQHGSLLKKNNDKALMIKLNDYCVKICARGYWPDNILFIVHDVFETLISDSFSGVTYEYQLACKKCLAERDVEPHLFSKNVLIRASNSKTVFVQCHRNFHINTMTEIQESMPPDNLEDYDVQFKRTLQLVSSAQENANHSIVILVSKIDYESTTNLLNTTKRIVRDLQNKNYSVWCVPVVEGFPQDDYINNLTRAEVVIAMMSGNFTDNNLCLTLFSLAKNTLRKNMSFAVLDKNYASETLGLEVAGEKYINFIRDNVYDIKLKELIGDIESMSDQGLTKRVSDVKPKVFISYCWDNSERAFQAGNSKVLNKNAIGWGDPRNIKDFIEQNGISCWIDVEMIGTSSVYSGITAGLKNCELVVACLSNEYAMSDACRKEFMFARQNLNLPIIVAEVGSNLNWIQTELGLLAIEHPKISFVNESPTAFDDLLMLVKDTLSVTPDKETASNEEAMKINRLASQEDFELIQRKIYRLLTSGFGSEEGRMYPNLFFVDILDIDESASSTDAEQNLDFPLNGKSINIPKFSLCFKILCENETGWHTVDEGIPITLGFTEQDRLLTICAPYLHRITLLLKYSNNVNIKLFQPKTNQAVVDYILNIFAKYAKSWSLVKPIHRAVRYHILSRDKFARFGGLQNCCLNNGKIVWLCPEHSALPHISLLGPEESVSLIKQIQQRTESMKEDNDILIKDSSILTRLEEIINEVPSDADSSADSRKINNETNRMIDVGNLQNNKATLITESYDKKPLKSARIKRLLTVKMQNCGSPNTVTNQMTFKSKTCSIM